MRLAWLFVAAAVLTYPTAASAETFLIGPSDLGTSGAGVICQDGGLSPCARSVPFQTVHGPGVEASAPKDGTITSWRVRGSVTGPAAFALMTVRPQPSGKFVAVGITDPAATFDGSPNPASLPYKANDRLAIVMTSGGSGGSATLNVTFTSTYQGAFFTNAFGPGSAEEAPAGGSAMQLLFNATVEAAPPPTPSPGAGPQTAKISALSISPKAFEAAKAGGSVIAKIGGKVSYSLDKASDVVFTISRASKGRKSGKKCVTPKRNDRSKKRCTRYTKLKGSFTRQGTAGANSFTFSGRLNNKALRKGTYRLEATAVNGSAKSASTTSQFRIKR